MDSGTNATNNGQNTDTGNAAGATAPFHEAIRPIIGQADANKLEVLAEVINATTIPRGLEAPIAQDWTNRVTELGLSDDYGVPAALASRNTEVAAATASDQSVDDATSWGTGSPG